MFLTQYLSLDFLERHKNNNQIMEYANYYGIETETNGFIPINIDFLDWQVVICCRTLTEEFIEKYLSKISVVNNFWSRLLDLQNLSEKFLRKYCHLPDFPWDIACSCQNMTEEFIKEHFDLINSAGYSLGIILCGQPKLSTQKSVIEKKRIRNYDKRNDGYFSENFLGLRLPKCHFYPSFWISIFSHYNLSLEFIETYQNVIDWEKFSAYAIISPEIMEKFNHKLNHDIIKNKRRN